MKKLICVILVSLMLVSTLGMAALAFDPDNPDTPDTISYFTSTMNYSKVEDSAFYMYYGPYAWDTHCWTSTKISVADDHYAFAYAWIKHGNKSNYEYDTTRDEYGYVETAGAFLDEPRADFTQHYGERTENDGTSPEWNFGYISTGTLSLNEN